MNHEQQIQTTSGSGHHRRLALVLWNGNLGGAEILNVALADRMRQLGGNVTVVFVGTPWPLAERLSRLNIPYHSLGFKRGRDLLRYPRRYAAAAASIGPDGALLVERGFMGATLRAGGYRKSIVAVEHGAVLLDQRDPSSMHRLLRDLNRFAGARAVDAEIAVSDFMLTQMRLRPHAHRTCRIYNGIDPDIYLPQADDVSKQESTGIVVGFAGRLIPGKGTDHLVRAIDALGRHTPVKLLIAGEGPERPALESLVHMLGVGSKVEFLGIVNDLPAFWQGCDVAAIPSDAFIESFSMVTLEAMACGKAIVATYNGAIPELVIDGVTGTLVPSGDVKSLAHSLAVYAEQPGLRQDHGVAARKRAIEDFHIENCARAYLDLFSELASNLHLN